MLDLSFEELEPLDAPTWTSWVAGIGVGILVGAGAVAIGVAIT